MLQCCQIVLCYEILDQNRPVRWSIIVKEKPTADSPFFGAFPSDHIPKATKDVIYISLSTVAVPVDYTSKYRKVLKLLLINISYNYSRQFELNSFSHSS